MLSETWLVFILHNYTSACISVFELPQTVMIFKSANLCFCFSNFKDFSSKRSKESEKLFFSGPAKEEKKKQVLAHKGFRIPKKVIF